MIRDCPKNMSVIRVECPLRTKEMGILQLQTSKLFVAINSKFFKNCAVSARTREYEIRTVWTRVNGDVFVLMSVIGYWTPSYIFYILRISIMQHKGPVHKRRPQSGEGCLSSADKGEWGSSDANVHTFWRKKLWIFEIYGVSARTRGVEPVRTFCEQSVFRDFVRTSFMDGP